jgi:hypothetical protein
MLDKIVTIISILLMIIPTVFFSICYLFWIGLRNYFFSFGCCTNVAPLYAAQSSKDKKYQWIKASLVDLVSLKGETGCTGFAYALVHSFLGIIVADVAYKDYWFNEENGRMHWRMELSMMTGCVSTVLLWAVTTRSLFGHASWIRLKPLYAYASPIGVWFAVIHVMAFGAKGWNTLFSPDYHNGQMSITFVSSMFPACVLLVHHLMGIFGTKKHVADVHLWRHSQTSIATQNVIELRRAVKKKQEEKPSLSATNTKEFNLSIEDEEEA